MQKSSFHICEQAFVFIYQAHKFLLSAHEKQWFHGCFLVSCWKQAVSCEAGDNALQQASYFLQIPR